MKCAIEAVVKPSHTLTRGGSIATDCIARVAFRFQRNAKLIVAAFDVAHASSDGGALLLKALDERLSLTERVATCLTDPRQPGKAQREVIGLLRQRVCGLACGYADCNDAARLAHDPLHTLLLDRDPLTGVHLLQRSLRYFCVY